jgi:alkanesulfonate monooxygenase SsuD/methylene tetrahydromethanopterin reductase-like flavin-dependent oxidoreductase (luciferase family)
VQYAVDIPNFGRWSDPREVARFAREIEDAGWDGLSVWDHILVEDGMEVADPWILLAAAASATDRITLMNLVAPLPRRHPWKLSREAVSVDLLSGGRFVLGVGIGWPTDPEFTRFHQEEDLKTRGDMLDEGLEILTGLWSGEPFSFRGEHYTLDEVTFLPKPVQLPRIPIWVAGMWPGGRPFRRAASWDGIAPIGFDGTDFYPLGPDEIRAIVGVIRDHRTSHDPFDVTTAWSRIADRAEALDRIAELADAGVTWAREAWHPWTGFEFDDWRRAVLDGPPR